MEIKEFWVSTHWYLLGIVRGKFKQIAFDAYLPLEKNHEDIDEYLYVGTDLFTDREQAVKKANESRLEAIEKHKKQIKKLHRMKVQ